VQNARNRTAEVAAKRAGRPGRSTQPGLEQGLLENQSKRVEILGGMAAGLAHEFKNLLMIALGSLEQLRRQSLDERGHRQLERAEWSVQQAGRLAQQILSFIRSETGERKYVDLNLIIGEFDNILGRAAGDKTLLVLDLCREPLPVRLDPDQLELALLNLVCNATDAMSGSGAVTIRTVAHPSNELREQQTVEVSVTDTGSGMPPEIVERSTTPFFTTKSRGKGTGLGLWIVKRFAAAAGGKLDIDTEVGRGTTVRLIFPCAEPLSPQGGIGTESSPSGAVHRPRPTRPKPTGTSCRTGGRAQFAALWAPADAPRPRQLLCLAR
jgi:signal transduction histidine kinase